MSLTSGKASIDIPDDLLDAYQINMEMIPNWS